MKNKDMALAIDKTDDPDILHMVGSTEAKDADGDIIRVKGWDLSRYKQNPVFMFGHNYQMPPIGIAVKVVKNAKDKVLEFWIKFSKDEFAQRIKALYDEGVMRMSSVGFKPDMKKAKRLPPEPGEEEMPEWTRGWEFNGQTLLELSAVPIGSNPEALARAVTKGIATVEQLHALGLDASEGESIDAFEIDETKWATGGLVTKADLALIGERLGCCELFIKELQKTPNQVVVNTNPPQASGEISPKDANEDGQDPVFLAILNTTKEGVSSALAVQELKQTIHQLTRQGAKP